ncbi:MAG: CvpA family protein [Eubacteriales bacterium]|nr:CvpA family protein [Eubacteriales bacterium]
MEINLLTVIVLLIILLDAVRGYRRGFIKTLTSMVFLILTLVLVYFTTPYVRDFLKEHTEVYTYVEERCEALVGSAGEERLSDTTAQEQYIESLKLPEFLKEQLIENNNQENYAAMAVDSFLEYLAGFLANVILTILVYVVTFLLVRIVLSVAVFALSALAELPVLHSLNRILGFVLGAAQGVVFVWLVFLVLTMLTGFEGGRKLLNMIYESDVLCYLYDTNIFLRLLAK